jgi:molybdopterin synthase sulfur carrier subunit
MKILLFGVAQDIVGERMIRVDLEVAQSLTTVLELKHFLFANYPLLKNISSIAVAVNMEYATDDTMIQTSDEIALIPPVSGG